MLDLAWSTLSIKAIDTERRIISGIASTPTPDRHGDILEPAGAQFTLPLPFLWQHHQDQPLGHVIAAQVTSSGIQFTAQIARSVVPFIEEAWALIKEGLVRGTSVGWRPIEAVLNKDTGGLRVRRWGWHELSAVTVPANVEATILSIKSLDAAHLAASGTGSHISVSPGATGFRKDRSMQPLSEQITAVQAEIKTKGDRLTELMTQEEQDGHLNDADATERKNVNVALESLSDKLHSLRTLERIQTTTAQPLQAYPAQVTQTTVTTPRIEMPKLEKGTLFARYAMAVAAGRGSISDTIAYAKRWDGQTPEVSAFIKSSYQKALAGTSTGGSPAWGADLVFQDTLVSEFIDLLRPATVLGKLTGTRRTPFNVKIQVQTGGSTVNWVGQEGVKPVTQLAFDTITMPHNKIAGIVVMTEELVRLSRPGAEETVRRDLVEQIARFIDAQLLDPSVALGANNPASLTNGVAAVAASGTNSTALYMDLNDALATFDSTDMGTGNVYLVTTPAIARGISTLRNALGQFEFTGANPMGGTVNGFPMIVSSSVPSGYIILIKADEILLADDGGVSLDASNQATLDMDGGSPTSPVFSLWQRNCIAIRAERWITWLKRRADAVAVISGAAYGPSVGSP